MLTYTSRLIYSLIRGARAPATPVTEIIAAKFVAHPLDLDVNLHLNNAAYMRAAELARWQQCTQGRILKAVVANKCKHQRTPSSSEAFLLEPCCFFLFK